MPGEVSQATGRAYAKALLGCLEVVVPDFKRQFEVASEPSKLEFRSPSGATFSYDASGSLRKYGRTAEVLIELKGYATGDNLLNHYRRFVKNSFLLTTTSPRNAQDLFWFVTNVPFGAAVGRQLTGTKWILDQLHLDPETRELAELSRVQEFASNLSVAIFTDSFMKRLPLRYVVEEGDTLWDITRKMSGGRIPLDMFEPYAFQVGTLNKIDPDHLVPGQEIDVPWLGIADDPSAETSVAAAQDS